MWLFAVADVAAGVGVTWWAAGLMNRTVLEVTADARSARHGPVPWFGEATIPVAEIDQLYCRDEIARGERGATNHSYRLYAITRGGQQRELLQGLPEDDQALWLEQAIESRLGIRDRIVAGSWIGSGQKGR